MLRNQQGSKAARHHGSSADVHSPRSVPFQSRIGGVSLRYDMTSGDKADPGVVKSFGVGGWAASPSRVPEQLHTNTRTSAHDGTSTPAHTYVHIYIYIYIYIYRERERDIHIYAYIYIYIPGCRPGCSRACPRCGRSPTSAGRSARGRWATIYIMRN